MVSSRWSHWRTLRRGHSGGAVQDLEDMKAKSIGRTVAQTYRVRSKTTGERGVVVEFEDGCRIALSRFSSCDTEPFSVQEVYDYGSTGQIVSDVTWTMGESFIMIDFCGRYAPIMRVILYPVDNVT